MGKVISITSGKGGTGKSTLTVNCGMALSLLGSTVLLVDTDAGLRALDVLLGISGEVVYDLADVLCRRCEPAKAILKTPCEHLFFLPAPAVDDDGACSGALSDLCRGLQRHYDFILLDSPAGMGPWARAAAESADAALLVVTPDPVCIRDADRMAGHVLSRYLSDFRLVINRVQPGVLRKKLEGGMDAIIDAAAVQLIGVVPEDKRVTFCAYDEKPLVQSLGVRGGAAEAFCNIARRLRGEDVPLMKF